MDDQKTPAESASTLDTKIVSTPTHLKLIEYKPEFYAGITPDKNIVVIFPEDQSKSITEFSGDQGTTKSSNLACIRTLMGGDEIPNSVNSLEGKKSASMEFQIGENRYHARVTKSDFTLTLVQDTPGGKPIRSEIKKPKQVLRDLIGNLGNDPGILKTIQPAEQLKWLRSICNISPDFEAMEILIAKKYKESYDQRTNVNREVKRLHSNLAQGIKYFTINKLKQIVWAIDVDAATAKYGIDTAERDQQLKKNLEDAAQKKTDADELESRRKQKLELIDGIDKSILASEEKIKAIQLEITAYQESQSVHRKSLSEMDVEIAANATVEEKYQAAMEEFQNNSTFKLEKKEFDDAKDYFKQYQEFVESSRGLDNKLSELMVQKQKLVKGITPDIVGLEICVPSTVDLDYERTLFTATNPAATEDEIAKHLEGKKAETREGIYYVGRSVAELSESELWDLWLQLLKISGVRVVFIENITSLGSSAIDRINELAEMGCHVFYTAMERGAQNLKISFHNRIN